MKVVFRRALLAGLTSVALISSAPAKDKKDEPKDQPSRSVSMAAPASAEPGVLAVVGGAKITEQDLVSSLPPANQKAFQGAVQRIDDMEKQAMQVHLRGPLRPGAGRGEEGVRGVTTTRRRLPTNRDDFPDEFKSQIAQAKGQLYEGKRSILDDLVGKKLEENAAKAKGMTARRLHQGRGDRQDSSRSRRPRSISYYTANQRQFGGNRRRRP